jgi:hypothetical protein
MNSIDLAFADGTYTFALPLPQINELEQKRGIGIGGLFARVLKGRYDIDGQTIGLPQEAEFYAADLIETIRQGLLGGQKGEVDGAEVKVSPLMANRLITSYVVSRPLVEVWELAAAILGACVIGFDPPKKGEPDEEPAPETETTTGA